MHLLLLFIVLIVGAILVTSIDRLLGVEISAPSISRRVAHIVVVEMFGAAIFAVLH